ncbi:MAG: pilin [Candidatus Vogelbacteria bacterium]
MSKLIISLTIFALFVTLSANVVFSQTPTPCVSNQNGVCLLQPDIGVGLSAQESSLGNYLSILFKTLIGLAGGIAVLLIVVGGLQYILSEVPGVKSSGKERISNALIGLILALSAWLILNTINPDLINFKLNLNP